LHFMCIHVNVRVYVDIQYIYTFIMHVINKRQAPLWNATEREGLALIV